MTRDESLTIVSMVISHWHTSKEWSKEEMDVYARMVQDLDVEVTMSAVIRASKEIKYRPSIAELREYVRAEKKRLEPTVAPIETRPVPIPQWVRRWICARLLYARFGKERDDRRFSEQGDFGDLTREVMPDGQWEAEANSIDEGALGDAFKTMFRT